MAAPTYNTVAGDPRGAAMEGLEATISTLDLDIASGLIDGRSVPAVAAAVTAVAATTTFKGFLVSEDGDGTFTITHTADDVGASAALAVVAAEALDVPAGGTGVLVGAVNNTTTVSDLSISVRGKLPPVSADA